MQHAALLLYIAGTRVSRAFFFVDLALNPPFLRRDILSEGLPQLVICPLGIQLLMRRIHELRIFVMGQVSQKYADRPSRQVRKQAQENIAQRIGQYNCLVAEDIDGWLRRDRVHSGGVSRSASSPENKCQ